MKKVYFVWIGWIWISAVARYFNENWWQVFWSDKTESELIKKLKEEGIDIIIWEDESRIEADFDYLIYTEAVPITQKEIEKAKKLWIQIFTYPQSLALISKDKKLIAVSWSHGKSTTSSLIAIMLKNSNFWINAVIWTLLKEFDNKNSYFSNSDYFVIEACEYKRSFLNYKPYIWVITNIDLDHLDYYKDLEDYENAFKSFIENIEKWWFAIINWECESSKKLYNLRKDINYIVVYRDYFSFIEKEEFKLSIFEKKSRNIKNWKMHIFPKIKLNIPWEHILFDSHIVFALWMILWLEEREIIKSLENFNWVWRRSEVIWTTNNWNLLMSDYWHHPKEIKPTLKALKEKYSNKRLFVIFQPHQYARTLSLLDQFKDSFSYADILIVPDIYASRDTKENMEKMSSKIFIENVNHPMKYDGQWIENTLKTILYYDAKNPNSSVILLLWAWNIDDLRYKIEVKK